MMIVALFAFIFQNSIAQEHCGRYHVQGNFLAANTPENKSAEDILVINPNARAAINLKTKEIHPEFKVYNLALVDAEIDILSPECSFSCFGKIFKISKISDPSLYSKVQSFSFGRDQAIEKKPCLKKYP